MARIYEDRAELYDAVYAWKDYAADAVRLVALLEAIGVPRGGRVLEAAVGTGGHAAHLRELYDVEGFDLSEGMLAVARRKLPGVRLWQADLRAFAVDEPVDALLCLFSSIGYLLDEQALRQAASAMARAVRPGGALIVEPWFTAEQIDVGRPSLQTVDQPDLKIARVSTVWLEGEIFVNPIQYLVARRGQPLEHFEEEHRLWCAPRELQLRVLDEAGFDVRDQPDGLTPGRGLLLGVRRG